MHGDPLRECFIRIAGADRDASRERTIDAIHDPIRVAAVPGAHPYVRAIAHTSRVVVLDDPRPPGAPAGQWWPPVALTARWIAENAARIDVLHVHFGLESFAPGELREALETARAHGVPVVFTVHDLQNPQLADQGAYRDLLDVVVPAADALVTLTPTAAVEVRERWQRRSTVVPHPTLAGGPPRHPSPDRAEGDALRIGMPLRDLRPSIDGHAGVRTLAGALALLPTGSARADVRLHAGVRDDAQAAAIAASVDASPGMTLTREKRPDDDALDAWLAGLDALVLPYRHGTHSGWAELCFDADVALVATEVGHIRAQHPGDFHGFALDDPRSLQGVLDDVRRARRTGPERDAERQRRWERRVAERDAARDAHVALYGAVYAALLRERTLAERPVA